MNIKDYIHLYLGCDVQVNGRITTSKLIEIHVEGVIVCDAFRTAAYWGAFKLLLRPLSDITDEERGQYDKIESQRYSNKDITVFHDSEATRYLLSKHFDLFGLIEAGLAIDKTKEVVA